MKRLFVTIILIVFMSLITVAGNRKIVVDKYDDGVHVVEALGCRPSSFTDSKVLNIGLQRWTEDTDTTYVVITNVVAAVNLGAFDDAKMLIKLKDDEIVELNSITSTEETANVRYGNPTVWKTRFANFYNSNSMDVSKNINYWYITPEQIMKLNKGVTKIRIQFLSSPYEKEWKKDKIGGVIVDSYNALKNYNNDESSEIYEGF